MYIQLLQRIMHGFTWFAEILLIYVHYTDYSNNELLSKDRFFLLS